MILFSIYVLKNIAQLNFLRLFLHMTDRLAHCFAQPRKVIYTLTVRLFYDLEVNPYG